jgi:hypothetical protein
LALAPYPASCGADSGRLKRAWLAGALGKSPSATSATLGTLGDMRAAVTVLSVYYQVWVNISLLFSFIYVCVIYLIFLFFVTASGRAG